MRVRTRVSLWYAAVMFVCFTVMGVLAYHAFVLEGPRRGLDHHRRDQPFGHALAIIVSAGVPAAVLALVGGRLLMGRAFVPIERLTRAVEQMHERNLGTRLPRTGNGDEIDRLTEVFNAMTARLEQSFQRIREFTLHASHELKTPLTVMHAEIETALREENPGGAQRERLLSQLDEVGRLASIVDGLSLLTKADAGLVALALAPVRLDELVREAVEDAQHLAQGRRLAVTLAECEAVCVRGDRHRLRQLLLNLSDNAVKYNRPQGVVTYSVRTAPATAAGVRPLAELVIANSGPGIPAELRERVFDRFFRGESSHAQTVEGCGLGLSIAKWIVEAHHGTIRVDSAPDGLTRTVVRLPTIDAASPPPGSPC